MAGDGKPAGILHKNSGDVCGCGAFAKMRGNWSRVALLATDWVVVECIIHVNLSDTVFISSIVQKPSNDCTGSVSVISPTRIDNSGQIEPLCPHTDSYPLRR